MLILPFYRLVFTIILFKLLKQLYQWIDFTRCHSLRRYNNLVKELNGSESYTFTDAPRANKLAF